MVKNDNYIVHALMHGEVYVDQEGNVFRGRHGPEFPQQTTRQGYKQIRLACHGGSRRVYVHRVVAIALHGKSYNPLLQVNHIDGSKCNNDPSNLEWVTPKENIAHAHKEGLMKPRGYPGIRNPNAKLSQAQIHRALTGDEKSVDLGGLFGVSPATISRVRREHGRPSKRKLRREDAMNIRANCSSGNSQAATARKFGVSLSTVWRIMNGKVWS